MLRRIGKLSPYTKPRWGSLTAKGMMYHYSYVTNEILSAKPINEKPTTKERVTKIIGLYLMKNFPKGIKSSGNYVKEDTTTLLFITEKEKLITIVKKIAVYEKPIYGKHPFFGPMQTHEWRRFLYKHLDHHLRQFGV